MRERPFETCGDCQRWRQAEALVPPEEVSGGNPIGPSFVIVGQDPGKQEERDRRPWVGPSGQYVRSFIDTMYRTAGKFYLTNACLCRADYPPTKEEVQFCSPNLVEVFDRARERGRDIVTMACGRVADYACRYIGETPIYVPHPSVYVRSRQSIERWVVHARSKISVNESFPDIPVSEWSGEPITSDIVSMDAEFLDITNPFLVSVYDGSRVYWFSGDKLKGLRDVLRGKRVIAHNAVVEGFICKKLGVEGISEWIDTLTLARCVEDQMVGDLKSLVAYLFGWHYPKQPPKKGLTSEVILYNARDTYAAYRVFEFLRRWDGDRVDTFRKVLISDLVNLLVDMGSRGLSIDRGVVSEKKAHLVQEAELALKKLREFADINWNSSQQVSRFFGVKSVDKAFLLEKMALKDEAAEYLFKYRKAMKLLSTFIKGMETDRVYFLLSPSGTETGRLSFLWGDVNVHTIPDDLRECFVADEGHLWVKADFSTHEVRVLAWLAETPVWRDNVVSWSMEPAPIHEMLSHDDPYDSISYVYAGLVKDRKLMRDVTKMTFLALMYGAGPKRIWDQARRMGVEASYEQVSQVVRDLRSKLVSVERLRKWVDSMARMNPKPSFTWPPLYRRRTFDIKGREFQEEYRKALINTPTQGAAADITTLAALEISKKYRVVNIVHDEVDVQVPEGEVDEAIEYIRDCMLTGWSRRTPWLRYLPQLKVEISVGRSWAQ